MNTLLCIDPGGERGHTGVVLLGYTATTAPVALESWAVPNGLAGMVEFEYPKAERAVVEHFVNRNQPGADLSVVLTEGAVLTRLIQLGITYTLQPAAGKNTAVPNAVLKSLGLWFKGDHHHDRSEAARHGLIWLKRARHWPTLEAILAG